MEYYIKIVLRIKLQIVQSRYDIKHRNNFRGVDEQFDI